MQRRGESEQPVKGRRHRAIRPKARKALTARLPDADLQEQLDQRTRRADRQHLYSRLRQLLREADIHAAKSHVRAFGPYRGVNRPPTRLASEHPLNRAMRDEMSALDQNQTSAADP